MPWIQLGATVNVDGMTDVFAALGEGVTAVDSAVQVSTAALGLANALVVDTRTAVQETLDQVTGVLTGSVQDLLSNNVSIAVHTNVLWDPTWTFKNLETSERSPWVGSGLKGWFQDIVSSSHDPTDPFRPVNDEETEMGGYIFLKGIAENGDLADIIGVYQAFSDFSDFSEAIDMVKFKKDAEARKSLMRLGPGVMDDFFAEVAGSGDLLRSSVESLGDSDGFLPKRGSYPKWASVQVASILPPMGELMEVLDAAIGKIKPPIKKSAFVNQLIGAVSARLTNVNSAIDRSDEMLVTLASAISFFTSAYIIQVPKGPGGMAGFASRALAEADKPEFGSRGIVGGAVLVTAEDDPLNHISAFLELLGIRAADVASGTEQRAQNLDDMYDDLFP